MHLVLRLDQADEGLPAHAGQQPPQTVYQAPEPSRSEILGAKLSNHPGEFLLELARQATNQFTLRGRGVRRVAAGKYIVYIHLRRTSSSSANSQLLPGFKFAPHEIDHAVEMDLRLPNDIETKEFAAYEVSAYCLQMKSYCYLLENDPVYVPTTDPVNRDRRTLEKFKGQKQAQKSDWQERAR